LYIYVRMHIKKKVRMYQNKNVYTHKHTQIHIYTHIQIYIYIHTYIRHAGATGGVCVCVYMCVCVCVCIHIHTYIYKACRRNWRAHTSAYAPLWLHTSAYVSIRQHTYIRHAGATGGRTRTRALSLHTAASSSSHI
jgi:hypothetical protein